MKVKEMPYGEIKYWMDKVEELKEAEFTKKGWCDIGHALMAKHGISERVAVRLLQGDIESAIALELEEDRAHD